jgi:hypothetical protein
MAEDFVCEYLGKTVGKCVTANTIRIYNDSKIPSEVKLPCRSEKDSKECPSYGLMKTIDELHVSPSA